jgi:hypothetical protein
MALKDIVAQFDEEVARLQQARSFLAASGIAVFLPAVRRGRPKTNGETPVLLKPAKKNGINLPKGSPGLQRPKTTLGEEEGKGEAKRQR